MATLKPVKSSGLVHVENKAPSILHLKVNEAAAVTSSFPENVKVIDVEVVNPPLAKELPSPSTAESMVVSGSVVSPPPVVSCTVTLNVDCVELPDASVAVQVTSVVVIANVVPDAGLQVTVGAGSTASLAVGLV